jgi:serine/threonine-protein kinase
VLSAGPRQVEVADVTGEAVDDATARLTDDGLVVDTTDAYHESVPEGVVIASDPEAGEVVDEATGVTLTVSLGRRPIEVPELRGETLDDARAILRDHGLESDITQRPYHDTAPEGTILGQNPAPGEILYRGDTVDLAVSRGPEPIEVPNVRGDQRDDAVGTLEALGFEVDVRESGGIGAFLTPGRVYDQDPAPGATRFPGDTITIYAYEG